uniref:IS110 family transposase n=1 Tax=Sulfitobacter faviae TaxID=1775881 RepID=UPI003899AC01
MELESATPRCKQSGRINRGANGLVTEIARYLTALPVSIERIGFESGTLSQHLFYGSKAEGFEVVCMEARQVSAALSAMRNKTDRNDARGIAQILRTGCDLLPIESANLG